MAGGHSFLPRKLILRYFVGQCIYPKSYYYPFLIKSSLWPRQGLKDDQSGPKYRVLLYLTTHLYYCFSQNVFHWVQELQILMLESQLPWARFWAMTWSWFPIKRGHTSGIPRANQSGTRIGFLTCKQSISTNNYPVIILKNNKNHDHTLEITKSK